MGKWVHSINEVGAEHNALVGKKCANLGEMAKIGIPVPRGFFVTVDAHREFMNRSGIAESVERLVKVSGAPHGLAEYAEIARRLRAIANEAAIPEEILSQIREAYGSLAGAETRPRAVAARSAGTASHPGQYETYLNLCGFDEVVAGIRQVWSSIFNERTLAALDREGLSPQASPPIGVAVIEMVNARASGVGFTCDPNNGDTSRIFLEGAWGLGEGVVSGEINPDRWVISRKNLVVLSMVPGRKTRRIVLADHGTVQEAVPECEQLAPCVSSEEATEIARYALALEDHFGCPQDVEWCVSSDGEFRRNIWVLQTRPAKISTTKPRTEINQTDALAALRALRRSTY